MPVDIARKVLVQANNEVHHCNPFFPNVRSRFGGFLHVVIVSWEVKKKLVAASSTCRAFWSFGLESLA